MITCLWLNVVIEFNHYLYKLSKSCFEAVCTKRYMWSSYSQLAVMTWALIPGKNDHKSGALVTHMQ